MNKIISFLTGGWLGPLIGIVAIVGSLWAAYAYIVHTARNEGRAEVQALWDKDTQARALLVAAAEENKRVKEAQHAEDIAKERAQRERDGVIVGTVLADTRTQLERLRSASSAVATKLVQACENSATGRGIDAAAEASRSVFDECAGRRVEVAADAEQLAKQVRGLQAWASSAVMVCGPSPGQP